MMLKGIDCATKLTESQAKALKDAGYDYAIRYLGPQDWKRFDKAEADAIQKHLKLVSVWEDNPTHDSYFTYDQGKTDAIHASAFAKQVGQPIGSAIYFAVDYDCHNISAVKSYFKGVKANLDKSFKVGVYGSYDVVMGLKNDVDYFFQTYAWSHGKVADHIHILQYKNGQVVEGIKVDLDNVLKSPGHWVEPVQLDYVKFVLPTGILKQGDKGPHVKQLQEVCNHLHFNCGEVDGIYGPKTADSVKRFQMVHLPYEVDSIYGPHTRKEMIKLLGE